MGTRARCWRCPGFSRSKPRAALRRAACRYARPSACRAFDDRCGGQEIRRVTTAMCCGCRKNLRKNSAPGDDQVGAKGAARS